MCLGIPGKIKEIYKANNIKMAKINYSGVEVEVCLEATPDANVGEYVIVHAGFSISRLSEEEANETLDILREIDKLYQQEHNQ